jgi:hypothetical protein
MIKQESATFYRMILKGGTKSAAYTLTNKSGDAGPVAGSGINP